MLLLVINSFQVHEKQKANEMAEITSPCHCISHRSPFFLTSFFIKLLSLTLNPVTEGGSGKQVATGQHFQERKIEQGKDKHQNSLS